MSAIGAVSGVMTQAMMLRPLPGPPPASGVQQGPTATGTIIKVTRDRVLRRTESR